MSFRRMILAVAAWLSLSCTPIEPASELAEQIDELEDALVGVDEAEQDKIHYERRKKMLNSRSYLRGKK